MTDLLVAARFYLTPPAGHFWLWSEDGEVVLWQRGATIAFRKELKAVVERLAPRGLPAFDEILLLFASCRWDSAPSTDLIIAMFESDSGENGESSSWPYEAFSSIDQMWRLPADVREPLEAKALLAEVVFETRPPIVPPEVARVVIELLDTAAPDGFTQRVEFLGTARTGTLRQSVDYLIRGMQRVDVEALRLRRKTGLDVPPQPAATEDDPHTTPGDLIARLSEDAELGGMARLARNLLAVTDLPRSVSDSDELPLGGVSDIGNRGTFDRLLLSELAQDDLTLSVRVALNEALYLRRESPPRNPPQRRLILIDSGLRMWGVPRVFAASVALAFAARTSKGAELSAWRAAGESLEPVDLRTREGLVKHLEALDATLHPGASIPAFVREIEQSEEPPEAVIIVETDTLDDETFVRALDESAPARLFVATVRRNGEFRLWLRTPQGRKLIREATLDLERILFAPTPRRIPPVPLIDAGQQPLPAIFHVRPFPLRLPHRLDPKRVFFIHQANQPSSMMSRAPDGRLTLWDEPSQGPRQIAEGVFGGTIFWSHVSGDLQVVEFLIQRTRSEKPQLIRIQLSSGRAHVMPLNWIDGAILGASHQSDVLILTGREKRRVPGKASGVVSAAYHRTTGELLGMLVHNVGFPNPCGRFVLSPDPGNPSGEYQLSYVSWVNEKLEAIPSSIQFRPSHPTVPFFEMISGAFFHIPGRDGPFAIKRNGIMVNLSTGEGQPLSQDLTGPVRIWDVDPESATVILDAEVTATARKQGFEPGRFAVNFKSGIAQRIPDVYLTVNQLRVANHPLMPTQRRRWRAIAATGSRLFLQSRRGMWWEVTSDLKLKQAASAPSGIQWFQRMPRGTPYRMSVAAWADGSRAFADSRGLVHLQSSHREIPEISLVLTDHGISGWCADGRLFGDPYFTGRATRTPAPVALQWTCQKCGTTNRSKTPRCGSCRQLGHPNLTELGHPRQKIATDRAIIYRDVLAPFALHCRPDG
ncbi:MAG: hypothetical protein IT428_21940 [Planctomycetaceae bacterium]|nr:hypothetical protein [Planctomycetaceae bacterium]